MALSGTILDPASRKCCRALLCAGVATLTLAPALAEETVLIQPSVPFSYDKGRNVSVTEKPRLEYDPIGISAGSFDIFPKIELGLGYDSNIFLTTDDQQASAVAVIAPSVRASSDWSRHSLVVSGGARLRRFTANSRRNEDNWNIRSAGRVDMGSAYSLTIEGQASREQEEPFAAASDADIPSLSSFRRNFAAARGQYNQGRVRMLLAADLTTLRFNSIDLGSDGTLSQRDRDRDVTRLTGQGEYAFSPSLSAYAQLSYSHIDYALKDSATVVYRNGDGWRALGGINVDLSGFLRGSLGVGYSRRNYDATQFEDVGGVSAEGKLEYFPTELTTVTLAMRRVIEDAAVGSTSAFFDNRGSLRVDHELRYNILINARADIGVQDYIDSAQKTRSWRVGGGAKYLLSPRLQLLGDANFGQRRNLNAVNMPGDRDQFTALLSMVLQL